MRRRLAIFLVAVTLTFIPIAIIAGATGHWTILVGWVVIVNLVGVPFFRCPNCGRHAWRTDWGFFVPSVGTHCRGCKNAY